MTSSCPMQPSKPALVRFWFTATWRCCESPTLLIWQQLAVPKERVIQRRTTVAFTRLHWNFGAFCIRPVTTHALAGVCDALWWQAPSDLWPAQVNSSSIGRHSLHRCIIYGPLVWISKRNELTLQVANKILLYTHRIFYIYMCFLSKSLRQLLRC